MKILLADDDAASRLIAREAVRELGHECHTVSDGTQAWEAFGSSRPDVVISDWTMPGQTGLELCRNVRAHARGSYTYFILCTGHDGLDKVLEGMNAGADDYLLKPLNSEALQAHLISAARVTSLHRQLADQRTELEALNHELTAMGQRDPLTGLGNRRALTEDLGQLEARVRRYGHRYCLALLDVDQFKAYNDTYGHQAGDQVLQMVAERLQARARTGDALYRYGGEEFLCVLPEQSPAMARLAAERMRSDLEELAVPHRGNARGVLTLSAGVAMLDAGDTRSVEEVLKEADEALYRAKRLGRNRVEYAAEARASARAVEARRQRREHRRERRGHAQHDPDVACVRVPLHQAARGGGEDGDRIDVHERLEPRRQRVRLDEDVGQEREREDPHEARVHDRVRGAQRSGRSW